MLTTFGLASLPADFALAWAVDAPGAPPPSIAVLGDPLAANPIRLPADGVLFWLGTLSLEAELPAFAAQAGLGEVEQTQMSAFFHRRDAAAYAAAHGVLRLMLANTLNRPPADFRFGKGPYGKPFLCGLADAPGEPIHFNISHSKGLAAVALCRRPVGIDIEERVWREDLLDVARVSFAAEQQAALVAASGERRAGLFFRYWTLGEAFIKATGVGISQGLDTFAFTPDGPPRLTRVTPGWGPIERWHFGVRRANEPG